ncbi:hypothetical protein K525DRAFT_289384 [Schizophyllum commune Loenen D]|nr:hypothetical protein K525DRAFT_289384 [Schizophyllum commune Loenen D]
MSRLLSDATLKSAVAEHETRPSRGPQCSTGKADGRKRARTMSYDGSSRKRLRLNDTAKPDSHALTEILEEEIAQLKKHLEDLRAHEAALFMQLTTATLPTIAQTQQSAPSSSSPLLSTRERSRIPRSPHEKASLELAAREHELSLERDVRLATEQTLEDVQQEMKSPHVLRMLMGALEYL